MNTIILNPENYKNTYLAYLNQCFPNWGNTNTYDWIFERSVGEHESDILLIKDENNQVIAGSAVTYRKLKTANGSEVDFGIMTGSWTLPEARGKGCFSQMIDESKRICFAKGVPFLTAFVTESNASYRRLRDAGFYGKTADNVFSKESVFASDSDFSTLKTVPVDVELLFEKYTHFASNHNVFGYSKAEFEGQYIKRLTPTECIKVGETYCLFEDTGTIIKLLFLSDFNINDLKVFCEWMRVHRDKKVMFFLSDDAKSKIAEANDFQFVKGFFMVQKTAASIADSLSFFKQININLADKM
ncbi:GNAT family N-acetyltransferase [Flavobacterium phycosphaerae]|uniref:GNAT family N-acetyltransferase n=1 Tax=Flavobacterium phycosphaerae TaxID=2697515 RepID=UPI0013893F09|nr:GNAT family N-acetyltransferase [Flavobacterium phycosphaerae]